MTTANRLIDVLNDAKKNRLTVSIVEQADGKIFTSVNDGYYTESFTRIAWSISLIDWK